MRPGLLLLSALMFALAVPAAHAATANETQALYFGQWYVNGNTGVYTITVNADGSYNHSGNLTMLRAPRPGVYNVTGLTPDATITNVTVMQTQAMQRGGNDPLAMSVFDVVAPPVVSPAGNATVTVGGTASTTGSGAGYGPGDYNGNLVIQFDLNL